jgi:hypothetical protein
MEIGKVVVRLEGISNLVCARVNGKEGVFFCD